MIRSTTGCVPTNVTGSSVGVTDVPQGALIRSVVHHEAVRPVLRGRFCTRLIDHRHALILIMMIRRVWIKLGRRWNLVLLLRAEGRRDVIIETL